MWDKIQQWFALQRMRWDTRKHRAETISFSRAVKDVRNILICLPWEYREFRVARYVLKFLPQSDEHHQITFVVPASYADMIPGRPQDRVIAVNGNSRDKLGRFNDDFSRQVLEYTYQAAADFNSNFDYGTSLLCLASEAPLRIGFSSPYAELFFNVEIDKPEKRFLLEGAYRSIQRLLAIETSEK